MPDLDHLGPALRLIRRRRGLRQCDMAERAGITRSMASAYERGRRLPSLRTLDALLDALDADLGVLQRAIRHQRRQRT